MKTNIITSAIAIAVTLSGCSRSGTDTKPAPTPDYYLSIMHLAPTAPPLDIFFDNTPASYLPFRPGAVTDVYNGLKKGVFSIKFKKENVDSLVAQVPTYTYDSLNYYTIFIYNLQANGPVKAARIKDDFTGVLANLTKPYYRFFHASPNTGAVDFYIDNIKVESGRTNADNVQQEVLNKFLATTTDFHNLEVKLAGTNTAIASLNYVGFEAGNAYTIYLKGLNGGSGLQELSIGILRAAD